MGFLKITKKFRGEFYDETTIDQIRRDVRRMRDNIKNIGHSLDTIGDYYKFKQVKHEKLKPDPPITTIKGDE